ncbi:MAG: conjugal transfer protein TraH [Nitrospinae bacterium]|nr:conjugal transfer protein TraH [Nitrospinota bacterium]
MMLKRIAALTFSGIFAVSSTASAGGSWVGDQLNNVLGFNPSQQTGSGPSEFQGQQRNFWTGGGYQARAWSNTPEYVFSLEKPHFNVGCGGVDMFLGSYSMMKMEYLAAKMQKIMQQAPTFATMLAIQELVAPVAENLKQFESILDQINNINLNECGMTKTMVAVLQGAATGQMTGGEALTRFAQEVGIDDNWYAASKKAKDLGLKNSAASPLGACPADIDQIFLTGGSVLSHLGTLLNIPPEHVDMMRGVFGDIRVVMWDGGAGLTLMPVDPCQQNGDLTALVEGRGKIMDASGTCLDIPDANKSIRKWVETNVTAIKIKIKGRQDLGSGEVAFIQAMRQPVYNELQAAIASGEPNAVIMNMAEEMALDYAYYMLYDLYVRMNTAMVAAQSMIEAKRADSTYCKISLVKGELGQIQILLEKANEKIVEMRAQYAAFTNTMTSRQKSMEHYQRYKTTAFNQLSDAFGTHIAARAVR